MRLQVIAPVLGIVLLPGCATEWRSQHGTVPTTYPLPAYRVDRSVGNLRRLAVLPPRLDCVGAFALWTQSSRLKGGACESCSALADKGYQILRVGDDAGAWRAEAVVAPEFGPIEELERAWAATAGDEARARVVQRLGRALQVDGIVAVWAQEPRCEKASGGISTFLLGFGAGIANIALMDLPLVYYLQHTYAEALVYETASGAPVWRSRLSGPTEGQSLNGIWSALFSDMENAIPSQLVP
jgi:hypothetical protein